MFLIFIKQDYKSKINNGEQNEELFHILSCQVLSCTFFVDIEKLDVLFVSDVSCTTKQLRSHATMQSCNYAIMQSCNHTTM
jgi:hypothetical protein